MKKINLLTLIIILTIPFACRYKEGPDISFRSVKSRLFGNWKVIGFTSDGIDSLQYYNDSCGCIMHIPKLSDEQDMSFLGSKHNGLYNASGTFSFSNNKKKMIVTYKGTSNHFGPIGMIDSVWEILKLTKDEFKILTNVNNRDYLISFKKTSS